MFDLNTLYYYGESLTITPLMRILVPLIATIIIVGLYFALCSKTEKGIKITKIVLASILVALYLGKVIFWFVRLIHLAGKINVYNLPYLFGLDYESIMIIVLSVTLYLSAFAKKSNTLNFLEHFCLGIATTVGVISLLSCIFIDKQDNLYHITNIMRFISNILLIYCPLFLVKIKEIKPNLNNFWYSIAGYICLVSLVMTFSYMIPEANISGMSSSPILYLIGIKISFPWHLLITIPTFVLISFGIYSIYYFATRKKNNIQKIDESKRNEFFDLYSFATKSICCMQGFIILIIIAVIIKTPLGTMLALLCLIPLVMTLCCVYTTFLMDKQADINTEEIFDEHNKIANKILTLIMIGNIFYGLNVKKQFRNERESIIDRKEREEKRKKKEEQKKLELEKQIEELTKQVEGKK